MSVPLLHSKTCLLAVLYVPYGHQGPAFSSDEPLRPESHLYDRALAPDTEEPRAAGELLPTRRPRTPDRGVHRALQPPAHAPLARAWLITAE